MVTQTGTFVDDTLIGVNGTDNIIFGDSDQSYGGLTGGNDTITGGDNATNTLYGDAPEIRGGHGTGGNRTPTSRAKTNNITFHPTPYIVFAPTHQDHSTPSRT